MRPTVLQLLADAPDRDALGGVAVHVAALAECAADQADVYTAHPAAGELRVERWGPRRVVSVLRGGAPDGLEGALLAAIGGTRANVVHVHSPLLGPRALSSARRKTGVPFALTLHDHALVCENYTLLETGQRFCGIPADLARCDRCLGALGGRPPGAVLSHREAMRELAAAMTAVLAPSDSVAELVGRVHPDILSRTTRIDWGVPEPRVRSTALASRGGPLAIGVVGVLSREKGRAELPALLAACASSSATFHVFGATEGESQDDLRRSARRVLIHGAYRRPALAPRLVKAGISVCLLPSVAPESFSLVLSEVLAVGIPVIVSNLGALAERVSRGGFGWTFDPFDPGALASLLESLDRDRALIDAAATRVRSAPPRTEREMAADHVAVWRRLAAAAPGPESAALREVPPAWTEGVRLADRRPSALAKALAALRRTDTYRDLPLRRLLSVGTRKRIEAFAAELAARFERR